MKKVKELIKPESRFRQHFCFETFSITVYIMPVKISGERFVLNVLIKLSPDSDLDYTNYFDSLDYPFMAWQIVLEGKKAF